VTNGVKGCTANKKIKKIKIMNEKLGRKKKHRHTTLSLFKSEEGRVILSLPCLQRIAPTPSGSPTPNPNSFLPLSSLSSSSSSQSGQSSLTHSLSHYTHSKSPSPSSYSKLSQSSDSHSDHSNELATSPSNSIPLVISTTQSHSLQSSTSRKEQNTYEYRKIAVVISGDPDGIPTFLQYGLGGGRFLGFLFHELGTKQSHVFNEKRVYFDKTQLIEKASNSSRQTDQTLDSPNPGNVIWASISWKKENEMRVNQVYGEVDFWIGHKSRYRLQTR
jgi:hypothetical protein